PPVAPAVRPGLRLAAAGAGLSPAADYRSGAVNGPTGTPGCMTGASGRHSTRKALSSQHSDREPLLHSRERHGDPGSPILLATQPLDARSAYPSISAGYAWIRRHWV